LCTNFFIMWNNNSSKSNILLVFINVMHLFIFLPILIWGVNDDFGNNNKLSIILGLSLILLLYVYYSWKLASSKLYKYWLIPSSCLLAAYYLFLVIPSPGISLIEGSAFGVIFMLIANPIQIYYNLLNTNEGFLSFFKKLIIGGIALSVVINLVYFWDFFSTARLFPFIINMLVGSLIIFSVLINSCLLVYLFIMKIKSSK
jgi:hypothetical protein